MTKQRKPPKGAKKKTNLRENTGKVFMNLGQLIFGTLFLSGVLRGEISHYIMMGVGIIGAGLFILCGLFMAEKETGKEA
jgi:hypothetical protein